MHTDVWVAGKLQKIDTVTKSGPSFRELTSKYLSEITPHKRMNSQKADHFKFKALNKWFEYYLMKEIDVGALYEYVKHRRETVGVCNVNRELAFLSTVFNYAIKELKVLKRNPVSRIKKEPEPVRRKFFEGNEFEEIFEQVPDRFKNLVLVARNTGLRVSNLANLKCYQVSIKRRLATIEGEHTKNQEALNIPLNNIALKGLNKSMLGKDKDDHVFTQGNGRPFSRHMISKHFKKACIRAGYPSYRFHDLRHDLRHDFCSRLVQKGVDLYRVKNLVGHKHIETTQRYSHLRPGDLMDAVSLLD